MFPPKFLSAPPCLHDTSWAHREQELEGEVFEFGQVSRLIRQLSPFQSPGNASSNKFLKAQRQKPLDTT